MTPKVQFCQNGHDTFVVGRNSSRKCKQCARQKALEWYYNNREKGIAKAIQWRKNNKAKYNMNARRWRKANPEKVKRYGRNKHLRLKYNINQSHYDQLCEQQNWLCAICGRQEKLVVDHHHESSKLRSLLCDNCNRGLGCFKDNPDLLKQAIEYLRHHDFYVA